MPLNQPYDPRYNAKVYVPKQTEEERRARATPLENLRSLRFRSEVPAAPVEVPVPAESVPQAPAPEDSAAPQDVPVPARASDYRPTAPEVVFAEFPEIFAPRGKQPLSEAHADDESLVSAGPVCNDAESDHPRQSTVCDRSHYTALLACETGTQSFPAPLHMDVENEVECAPYILRNQAYLTPGCGSKVELMRRVYSGRKAIQIDFLHNCRELQAPTLRCHTPRSCYAACSDAPRALGPPRLR